MALTYTQLKAQIEAYTQNSGTTFVASEPNYVRNAENRIFRDVDLLDGRQVTTGSLVAGTATVTLPTGFLYPRYMKITVSSVDKGLLLKSPSFIRQVWPTAATQGEPKYYSISSATALTLAATPDSTYAYTLGWYGNATSIVTGSTSWLGDNAEDVLLYACLVEAYTFMKGSPELLAEYKTRYAELVATLKIEQEVRNKQDAYSE